MKNFKSRFCMTDQGFLAMTHRAIQTKQNKKKLQIRSVRFHTAIKYAHSVIIKDYVLTGI